MIKKKPNRIIAVLLIFLMVYCMPGIYSFADILPYSEESTEGVSGTVLYSDGTLIINQLRSDSETNISAHGDVIKVYSEVTDGFKTSDDIYWKQELPQIKNVMTGSETVIKNGSYLFYGLKNAEEINLTGFDFTECRDMTSMFEGTGNMELKVTEREDADGIKKTGELIVYEGTITDKMFKNANICCNLSVKAVPDSYDEVFMFCNEYDQIKKKYKGHITIVSCTADTGEWTELIKAAYRNSGIDILHCSMQNEETGYAVTPDKQNENTETQKDLTVELKSAAAPPVMLAASGDTIPVKYDHEAYSYLSANNPPPYNLHAVFTTTDARFKGHNIICGEHHIDSPVTLHNTKNLPIKLYNNNQMIRKIMYYGWKGVKPWSGFKNQKYVGPYYYEEWCGVGITSNALTKAYGGKGSYDNVWGMTTFYNYCKNQPNPPDTFQVYRMEGGKKQDLFTWRTVGKLTVTKGVKGSETVVKNKAKTQFNLEGATFGVYSDAKCTKLVKTLTSGTQHVDAKGWLAADTDTVLIDPGTYYIKETKAPQGYNINSTATKAVVTSGKTTNIRIADIPKTCTLEVKKESTEPGDTRSMEGALYAVYNTFNDSLIENAYYHEGATGNARGGKGCIHIFQTDASGNTEPYTGCADEFYYIREIKAPPGFKLDPFLKRHVANDSDRGITDKTWQNGSGGPDSIRIEDGERWSVTSKEKPKTCTLQVKKVSADPDCTLSLEGALYAVYNTLADSLIENGAYYHEGTTGNARGGNNCIHIFETDKYGNTEPYTGYADKFYYIREIKAPPGFKLDPFLKRHVADDPDSGITDKTWQNGSGGPDSIRIEDGENWIVTSKEETEAGNLKLVKTVASNEHLVKECPERYDLKGAEYSVYTSETDALNNRTPAGKLITTAQKTDTDGKLYAESNVLSLPAGDYWIKENKAPMGYRIGSNEIPEKITVKGSSSVIFESKDAPEFDPLSLRLEKHIPEGKPWTKKYLKDAEYTVRYYPEFYYNEEELKGVMPMRTWIFRTDSDGIIQINEKNPITGHTYHIGGDELFKEEDGTVTGLWGTYTFEEIKAPPGFLINKGITIRQIHQGDKTVPDINATSSGDAVNVAAEEMENSSSKTLTVGKKISKDNVYKPYGYPTALFEIEGTDVYGKKIIYHETVTLDESTFDGTDYYAEFTLISLPAGEYKVSEIRTSRYKFKKATVVSGQGEPVQDSMIMNLINNHNGKVVFENIISRWNDYSHSHCIVNQF